MYDFDLPPQAWIAADKDYTDYDVEDAFKIAGQCMRPRRLSNN